MNSLLRQAKVATLAVSCSVFRSFLSLMIGWICVGNWHASPIHADDNSPILVDSIQLGLNGYWRLGSPMQASAVVRSTTDRFRGTVEWETVDANGVSVVDRVPVEVLGGREHVVESVLKHGRANRSIKFRVVEEGGKLLLERDLSQEEFGVALPVEQPWIVGLGHELGLDQAALRSAKGLLPSYSSTEIEQASRLPRTHQAYSGVDLLVIATSEWEFIEAIDAQQQEAISTWVKQGGRVLLWVGANGARVPEQMWLQELLGGAVSGIAREVDPGALESYLTSQQRHEPLVCTMFTADDIDVELSLASSDRKKFPLLFRRTLGFGHIRVFASDVDKPPMQRWEDRSLLLTRLFRYPLEAIERSNTNRNYNAAIQNYDDLSGQVHATLDQFPKVQPGSLTTIVTILAAFILMIGPFDYWVVSKRWRNSAGTWWSLLLWSGLSFGLIATLARWTKPSIHLVNSIEFIDCEMKSGTVRGWSGLHHYSGTASRFDFSATAQQRIQARRVGTESSIRPVRVDWDGYAGSGFGGTESRIRTDAGFPAYESRTAPKDSLVAIADSDLRSEVRGLYGVGLTTAGTKAFSATWSDQLTFNPDSFALKVSARSSLLEGEWTNPMKVDLIDGLLLYREWLYRLPSRIRPGGIAQVTPKQIPKDLSRHLQRRQVQKDVDVSSPWNPSQRNDPDRLMEMLALYQSAGGRDYTRLGNRPLASLDLSEHLAMNQVVVMGKIAEPTVNWQVQQDGNAVDVETGSRVAYVRFLIPVTVSKQE